MMPLSAATTWRTQKLHNKSIDIKPLSDAKIWTMEKLHNKSIDMMSLIKLAIEIYHLGIKEIKYSMLYKGWPLT